MESNFIYKIAIYGIPLLYAITLHEVAHGWVASKLGDPTAKMLGRLSINPVKHIDPIGTLLLPLLMLMVSNFIFGWAKPVPVTWENLKNPKRDMALVALAGPFANFLMAMIWGLIASLGHNIPVLSAMGQAGVVLNVVLMILNLLPIPPLDGSRVLAAIGSRSMNRILYQLEPYGLIILLLFLMSGLFVKLLFPVYLFFISIIFSIYGL